MTGVARAVLAVVVGVALLAGSQVAHGQPPKPRNDLEVIIAIDASGSMDSAIEVAKQAALEFVDALPHNTAIGVETFSESVEVLTFPTTDRALITERIQSIETGGDTALYDAVFAAESHFRDGVANKVLVILSDGTDDGSLATLDHAEAAAKSMRVEAISLTTQLTDTTALERLGTVTAADDTAGLSAAFARVAKLIVKESTTTTTTSTTTTTTTTTTTPPTTVPPTTPAPTSSAPVMTTTPVTTALPALGAPIEPRSNAPSARWLWAGAACVFLSLLAAALVAVPNRRVSRLRLGTSHPRNVSEMGVRTTSAIDELLDRHHKRDDLNDALRVASIGMQPAEFVGLVGAFTVIAGLGGLVIGGPLVAIAVVVVVVAAARIAVVSAGSRRRAQFNAQITDVLQLTVSALRSGYGIQQAMESVAEEAPEPARSEFARVLVEVRLGRDLTNALHALADRMRCKDLTWIVGAIDINRETGGNLAEILHRAGETIRERGKLAREVQTLTAEGRLSAKILTLLPFGLLLWQWSVNPEQVEVLTSGVGLLAAMAAGMMLVVGALWVRKAVNSVEL